MDNKKSKSVRRVKKNLKLIYFQHIRSILEFGVAAWNGSISFKQSAKLERVQKVALRLIYGRLKSYSKLCKEANVTSLENRREKLCLQFAMKSLKHPQFKYWFNQANLHNLKEKPRYLQCNSRTQRLQKSPIPYLTGLLNKYNGYK